MNCIQYLIRNLVIGAAAMLMFAAASYGQAARVFHGEISDSQCAMNVHSLTRSHQEMLKSKEMGGTPNTCSNYCIEHLEPDSRFED
jgi:hypothetical protein